jgi:hypothetical protein
MIDTQKSIDCELRDNLTNTIDNKLRNICERCYDNIIYTRKVNLSFLQFMREMYSINNSINSSFQYRGGFTSWGNNEQT